MNNMWNLSRKPIPCSQNLMDLGIHQSVISILWNRGYTSLDNILEYLRPSLFDLHSPFLFKDMQIVIDRIGKALNHKEKVLVYGDYDADGITGTSLIYKVLIRFGFNVIVYIPSRDEGYGLHKEIIEKAASNGVNLIITVDCGITALEEISLASSYGMDVIITDHHEPQNILPPAIGILNPKVEHSGYPFKYLAGVGVAFKLVQAIYRYFDYPVAEVGLEKDYLDLVALGTIADIVPLIGENRILTKYGLQVMEKTKHIGIRAIIEECGLSGKKLKSGQISFIVAPRINAAGRMDTARLALNLLLEDNYEEALAIAKELSKENFQRQCTEKEILKDAQNILSEGPLPEIIVLSSPNWNHGVIGIVASRLVEIYRRPVYLVSEDGEIGKGSARGIPGYHVLNELDKHSALLTKYGGHKQAAGFTLRVQNIDSLREGLTCSFIESGLTFKEQYNIDSIVTLGELGLNLHDELEQMAPFGMNNPAPLLMTESLEIKKIFTMGKENEHLKMILELNNHQVEALAFKKGNDLEQLSKMGKIDIIYSLEINNYMGEEKIQAVLKDYRQSIQDRCFSDAACSKAEVSASLDNDLLEICSNDIILNRQMLVNLYQTLMNTTNENNIIYWLPDEADAQTQLNMVKIFEELELVSWLAGTGPFLLKPNSKEKTNLQSSLRFRMLS